MNFLINLFKKITCIRIFYFFIILSFVFWGYKLCLGDANQAKVFFTGAFPCDDLFADFIKPVAHSSKYLSYEFLFSDKRWICYTPFAYFFFHIFDIITQHINSADPTNAKILFSSLYLMISSCCLIMLNFINLKSFSNVDKVFYSLAILCSYVYLFSVERANLIIAVMLFIYYFVFFYNSKNKILKEFAIIALAVATVLKISPIVFAWLLLLNRDYRAIFRYIAYLVILFILPCLAFPRGIESLLTVADNLKLLAKFYEMSMISGIGKFFSNEFLYGLGFPFAKANMITTCMYVVISAFCILSSFFYKKLWQKVLLLSLLLILIPSVSHEYTLLYFIPVLSLYLIDENKTKFDYLYLVWFLMIFNTFRIDYRFVTPRGLVEIAVICLVLQLLLYSVVVLYKNKVEYERFLKKYINLLKIFIKNEKQKVVFRQNCVKTFVCCLVSILILSGGCYFYHKNYTYDEYEISDLQGVYQFETNKTVLKDDFRIALDCVFIPSKPSEYENVFQTADVNDGLRFEISKDMNAAFLYSNKDKELAANFDKKIEVGKTYLLKVLITQKSFSTFLEEINTKNGINVEISSTLEKNTISKESVPRIIVGSGFSEERNFSGKVLSFDLKIKNGGNTNSIVVLTLLGFFLPFVFLFYNRNFKRICRKFVKKKNY